MKNKTVDQNKLLDDVLLLQDIYNTDKLPNGSLSVLGKKYGVSRERIRQIFAKYHLKVTRGEKEKYCKVCGVIIFGLHKTCEKHRWSLHRGINRYKYIYTPQQLIKMIGKQFHYVDLRNALKISSAYTASLLVRYVNDGLIRKVGKGVYEVVL